MANTMSHATHARRPSIRQGYSVVLGATRIKAGVGGDARAAASRNWRRGGGNGRVYLDGKYIIVRSSGLTQRKATAPCFSI